MKEAVGDNFSPKCMMMFGTLGEGKEREKKAEERKEKTESEKSKMVKAGLEILCSTHSTVIDFGSHCRLFESASKHTISLVRSGAKGRKEKEKKKRKKRPSKSDRHKSDDCHTPRLRALHVPIPLSNMSLEFSFPIFIFMQPRYSLSL